MCLLITRGRLPIVGSWKMYNETDICWHFRCLVVVRNLTTFHMWYSRKAYTVFKKDKESSFPDFQSSHDSDFLYNGCIYTCVHYMKQNEHCRLLTWINNFNIYGCNTSALSLICIIHFYFQIHQEGMLYLQKTRTKYSSMHISFQILQSCIKL